MGASIQRIKDADTEARELQSILNAVDKSLRASMARTDNLGMTYAEFKAETLKKSQG